jgi:hypothetical protein
LHCDSAFVALHAPRQALRLRLYEKQLKQPTFLDDAESAFVCVYYCRTYYKAVREGGGGEVEDMCYERLRAEACVI